jgi:hypothetical protein
LWDICYVEPNELEGPLGKPSHGVAVPDNFPEPVRRNHTNQVTFKVVQKLAFHNQNDIKYFLHLILVGLAVREDLANVVDRPLYLVDVPRILMFYYQGHANNLGGSCYVE